MRTRTSENGYTHRMTWDEIIATLKTDMEAKHAAREQALKSSRALIQTSSKCIKHIHRKQFTEAEALLAQAREIAREARSAMTGHPEVEYAGYLQDSEKEMVEAAGCLAIALNRPLPSPTELGVNAASYLNGMAECASEMRRSVLDLMRGGDLDTAERMLHQMEDIYDDLSTFDFPDGITGGLRRTNDALRAVIERTRSDLTLTRVQHQLLTELQRDRA